MDFGVHVSDEFEGEGSGFVEVAVMHGGCFARSNSLDDFVGAKDLCRWVVFENSVDLFFEAVVVVGMGDDDCLNVGFAFDRASVEAGIDDHLVAVLFQNEAGVLEFCDLHAFIVPRVLRLSKT